MLNKIDRIVLSKNNKTVEGEVVLPSSKSICNRLLIIKSFCKNSFIVSNISEADDTQLLISILNEINKPSNPCFSKIINTKNAATVYRFLIAYLSVINGNFVLTGNERMLKRPVKSLVDALKNIGADINYMENEGFPPLLIANSNLFNNIVSIDGSLSSQFISALLLIAPVLPRGLQINLIGNIVSKPYIDMTLSLMAKFNIKYTWNYDTIIINKQDYIFNDNIYIVEADWSAASYFYQLVAFSDNASLFINGLNKESIQGDAIVADIFKSFGVETFYKEKGVLLNKNNNIVSDFEFDFINYPDLFPAVAVTCAVLGINSKLTGLRNLKIKESDRLQVIVDQLTNMQVKIKVENDDILWIYKSDIVISQAIQTYNDHRIAMCFAPLALIYSGINILNPNVVEKSFPDYFNQLQKLGFVIEY